MTRLHAFFWGLTTLLAVLPATAGVINTVPTQGGVPYRAMVDGDWLVWSEAGATETTGSVYAVNISSPGNPVRTVANATASIFADWEGDWHPQIDVDDGYVVWIDTRTAAGQPSRRVRSLDLSNPLSTEVIIGPIGTTWGSEHYFPALDNGTVVWQAHSIMDVVKSPVTASDVQLVKVLPTNSWPVPDIGGNWVVWKNDTQKGGIYAFDLDTMTPSSTPKVLAAPDATMSPRAPVIDGDLVVWAVRNEADPLNKINMIKGYNLATDTPFTVFENTGSVEHKSNVSISGNIVVWEDWRDNPPGLVRTNLNVYGKNLVNGEVFPIADYQGNQHMPWISGNRVVWFDDNGGSFLRWTQISTAIHGDVNMDLAVNALDIASFVQRVTSGSYQAEADCDNNGAVNALDIAHFVALVLGSGGSTSAIPEPASVGLVAVCLVLTLRRR